LSSCGQYSPKFNAKVTTQICCHKAKIEKTQKLSQLAILLYFDNKLKAQENFEQVTMNPSVLLDKNLAKLSNTSNKIFSTKTGDGITLWEKIRVLGKGTFSIVYEVLELKSGERLAAKEIKIAKSSDKVMDIDTEAEILRQLDHPNIIKYIGSFRQGNHMYILTELCSAASLADITKRHGLSVHLAKRYFKQLVLAVQYLHKKNIIHRDIKPANIFISENNELKLGDFGLSTKVDSNEARSSRKIGTPAYMSPEAFNGQGYTLKSDIWSIGCCLYFLLCRKRAFDAPSLDKICEKVIDGKVEYPKEIDPSAKRLMQKCLSLDPKLRPSCEEILQDDFLECGLKRKSEQDFPFSKKRCI
jgi:serine/threonine protein kinase